MKKIVIVMAAALCGASLFVSDIGAQGKHRSRLDNCVRKCDGNFKNCLSSRKSSAKCAETRRACRASCAKSHGR